MIHERHEKTIVELFVFFVAFVDNFYKFPAEVNMYVG